MRGLKTHNPHRQHLADGGIVTRVKQAVGLDPEYNAKIAAYRQQQAAEKAAAASAAAASAPAPAKAVTDYSSGGAMKRREAAAGLANGGMVRGPGTGISDDVPDELPEGSYVLPADTTQAVGPQTIAMLDSMQSKAGGAPRGLRKGNSVPVNLSNGEYKLTPDQVHAMGVQKLDEIKNATHTPVGLPGANSDDMRMFLANGGAVGDDEKERLRRQTAMYVQGAQATAAANPAPSPVPPVAERVAQIPTGGLTAPARPTAAPGVLQTDPQAQADRAAIAGAASTVADSLGDAGRAAADVASLPIRAVAGAIDSTAVRGLRAAGINAPYISPSLVPAGVDTSSMTPFTDQKRMAQQPVAPVAAAQAVQPPVAAPAVAAPTAAPAAPAGLDGVRLTSLPTAAPAPPAGNVAGVDGVYRVGNSYSDSPAGAQAGAVARGLPSAQNIAAADALAARSGSDSTARVAAAAPAAPAAVSAPTVRRLTSHELRNLEVSAKSIDNNGGRFDPTKGNNPAQAAYRAELAADAAARGLQATGDVAAMNANAGLQREQIQQTGGLQREQVQQTGANQRAARGLSIDRERLGIDRTRAGSENAARDVATQGAQQIQQLRSVLTDPKATPEQRKQAETSLRAIGGRAEAANRYTVVPGGQEISPQGQAFTRPGQVLDNQTGQFVPQPGAQGAQPARVTGQVYTDANGKKAKWDGQKFVPA